MQFLDAVGLQTRMRSISSTPGGGFGAHGVQTGMLAGLVKLGDDSGERIADAGYLFQPFPGNELAEGDRAEGQVFCGATVRLCAVGVAARERRAVANFAE